jgi:3-oxoacyl-[acyl-carrier protein] reductase
VNLTGFDSKVAVVTGAGRYRGIGRTVALRLAEAGCDIAVVGSGRSRSTLPEDEQAVNWRDIESVADEIRELGRRAETYILDVSQADRVATFAAEVSESFGGVDILVNNAAAARGADRQAMITTPLEAWRRVIDVNLNGTFNLSQVLAAQMIASRRPGRIVNISALAGKIGFPNAGAYSASKHAIHALTTVMARELGDRNIRVNAVCPGIIDTSRLDDMGRAVWSEMTEAMIPVGRPGTPEDIAALVVFLCSDQAAWITGQAYNVDGGQLLDARLAC